VGDAPLPSEYGFDESLVCFEGLGDRILFPGNGLCKQSRKLGRGRIETVPKHESTENYVDRTIAFMQKSKDGDRPFYIELFPNDVHDAHLPKEELRAKYEKIADNPYEQKFFAVLEELDRQIGRLTDAVDRLGLAEETLIVFTSDNGPTDWPSYYKQGHNPPGFTGPFFGRKWSLYEGGIRMPFIARHKGVIPAGKVNDASVVCGIDLAPTFCSVAGVAVPDAVNFDGLDMTRALLGEPINRAEPIFWQYGDPHAQLKPGNPDFRSPSLAVRDGRWKLLINADGSEARLYDLKADPGESKNLVGDKPDLARELWWKIRRWARDVGHKTQDAPPVAPRT
jgi:arylsulfatase A-like enzyme